MSLPRVTISDFSSFSSLLAGIETFQIQTRDAKEERNGKYVDHNDEDFIPENDISVSVTLEDVQKYKRNNFLEPYSTTTTSCLSTYSTLTLTPHLTRSVSLSSDSCWSYTNSSISTNEIEDLEDDDSGGEEEEEEDEEEADEDAEQFINDGNKTKEPKRNSSGWRKVRSMVSWTPFIQTYKNRKYEWVQLSGHSGNFKAGKTAGTVLKKLCDNEALIYERLNEDGSLRNLFPEFKGIINDFTDEHHNQKYIQLQDCLSSFDSPSIMDCKIGVRTYLEEELAKAKDKAKLRKDMYDKMIAVDPYAPSEEEHRLNGVTKPRYMVWRETISSTATLGFRIEGVKNSDGSSSKDFKTTKSEEQVSEAFRNFISHSISISKQYLERLNEIHNALQSSEFFKNHELIGSSLLFVHDETKASIWLIDFGKTVQLPSHLSIDHTSPWIVGNHEDGYLIGVNNLISIFSEIVSSLLKS